MDKDDLWSIAKGMGCIVADGVVRIGEVVEQGEAHLRVEPAG
jgi:hypothetical protein